MAKEIKIACKGHTTLPLESLEAFQGDLKDLSKDNYKKLRKQILELGFSEPVSVWQHDGHNYLLNGHQRVRVLTEMKNAEKYSIADIPVNLVEADSEHEAKKKILSLTSQFGQITNQGLFEFASLNNIDLPTIEDFRFPEIDMDKWKAEFFDEPAEGLTDADEVPEVPQNIHGVKRGQIWKLGEHRLMCGDSTSESDVSKLMNGEKADMVFTDPPYGVDYDGGAKTKRTKLINDHSTDIYSDVLPLLYSATIEKGAFYIWHAAGYADMADRLKGANFSIRSQIIWNKNIAQFGALSAQYKQKHEPCFYCFKTGSSPNWYGPTNEVTVWDFKRESKNEYHPTQKPTELAERAIKNSSQSKDKVLDLFGGSGSTLIACEKTGRRCFMMELDEHYCSVIIERWQKFTGKTAELIQSSEV